MDFNSIVFPSPVVSRNYSFYKEEIVYVPKIDFDDKLKKNDGFFSSISNISSKKSSLKDKPSDINSKNLKEKNDNINDIYFYKDKIVGYVPCLFLKNSKKNLISKNILLYFHGNAEDIFYAKDIADRLRSNLNVRKFLIDKCVNNRISRIFNL